MRPVKEYQVSLCFLLTVINSTSVRLLAISTLGIYVYNDIPIYAYGHQNPLGVLAIPLIFRFNPFSHRAIFVIVAFFVVCFSLCVKLLWLPLLVMVACSSSLTTTTTVLMVPTLGQHAVVLPPLLIWRDTVRGVFGLITVLLWPPLSQIPSQAYPNYTIVPPQASFLFQSWAFHWFFKVDAC